MSDLVERLQAPTNWLRQGAGDWKSVVNEYDRAPFEAADEIIRLRDALERVRRFALAGDGAGFDLVLSVADQALRTQDEI